MKINILSIIGPVALILGAALILAVAITGALRFTGLNLAIQIAAGVTVGLLFLGLGWPGPIPGNRLALKRDEPWLAEDKALHFAICFAVTVILSMLSGNLWLGAGFALMLVLFKETWDKSRTGWSWKDLVAGTVGIAVGCGLVLL